ncbi:hypothetical protein BCF11_2506 [Collimonas sp. PA-H2]|nr:hypothetical protein BCF11_2506 [Collimonas sp. PA-H2]
MIHPAEPTLEINGIPPKLAGKICEGLICEQFICSGESVASANVTYLRFDGIWYRLYFEFQLVFWRVFDGEPKPWEVAEKTWAYPHTNVGEMFGILGQRLLSYEMLLTPKGSKVIFIFANNQSVLIEDADDCSSFRVDDSEVVR